jgi:hypothetical protein
VTEGNIRSGLPHCLPPTRSKMRAVTASASSSSEPSGSTTYRHTRAKGSWNDGANLRVSAAMSAWMWNALRRVARKKDRKRGPTGYGRGASPPLRRTQVVLQLDRFVPPPPWFAVALIYLEELTVAELATVDITRVTLLSTLAQVYTRHERTFIARDIRAPGDYPEATCSLSYRR